MCSLLTSLSLFIYFLLHVCICISKPFSLTISLHSLLYTIISGIFLKKIYTHVLLIAPYYSYLYPCKRYITRLLQLIDTFIHWRYTYNSHSINTVNAYFMIDFYRLFFIVCVHHISSIYLCIIVQHGYKSW